MLNMRCDGKAICVHKDYFLTLTKIQREVIRGSPIRYMLEFVGSGIDVDSEYYYVYYQPINTARTAHDA